MNDPCRFLQWDTDFFGHRIARVNQARFDPDFLESVYAWCESEAIECLYFLADSEDPQTINLAEKHGFRMVEIRIIFERSLKDWDPEARPKATEDVLVRPVQAEDIPVLQEIASSSYVDSRFYFDPHFSEDQWQAYYKTWVKNSCSGGAELALIAEKDARVIGYITGHVDWEKSELMYELTGVEKSARRAGAGQELFCSGVDWCVRAGIDYIWFATQGRNVATQRMVQRHGFLTRSCQIYYHKWFTDFDE